MAHDVTPFVVHESYLADHRVDLLRSGEGCIETLRDGSLLLAYGRFEGGSDAAPATLMQRRSADGGLSWSDPTVFLPTPPDVQNFMSLSFLRLQDGRLLCLFLRKESNKDCRPMIMFSDDDVTWTTPAHIIDQPAYFVVNNDRLVQLASGRILVPFARHGNDLGDRTSPTNGCVYSDDAGATWHMGAEIDIKPENVLAPKFIDTNPEATKHIHEGKIVCQEPGVIELADGRVLMWCRTTGGYAYRAISSDAGASFAPYTAIPEFAMPCGPQSIKRLPGSNRLIMLYNDRKQVPLGAQQFNWRRTLDVAISDDEAATWQHLGLLEPNTVPTTCYYSIAFHEGNVVFTWYEGVMLTNDAGWFTPSNLKSLKLKIVKQAFFEQ